VIEKKTHFSTTSFSHSPLTRWFSNETTRRTRDNPTLWSV